MVEQRHVEVCMDVCMCACVHVCMHACMYARVVEQRHVEVCMHACDGSTSLKTHQHGHNKLRVRRLYFT